MTNQASNGRSHIKERGFLLLEALLAITIVTLGTVAIMRTYSNSLAAGVLSEQYLTASNLAEEIVWQTISATDLDAIADISKQNFESPYSDYAWSRTIEAQFPEFEGGEDFENFDEGSTGGQENADAQTTYILYIIKITVSWQYRRHGHELKYQTAVMRKQPEGDMEELDVPPTE